MLRPTFRLRLTLWISEHRPLSIALCRPLREVPVSPPRAAQQECSANLTDQQNINPAGSPTAGSAKKAAHKDGGGDTSPFTMAHFWG